MAELQADAAVVYAFRKTGIPLAIRSRWTSRAST
jgi:hypothetical protein